jgi:glycosyltransferase involved in cell wall biosynthesis
VRVLLVNYRYFVSGGPERYMFGVSDLLERAGHEVVPFSIRYRQNRPSEWSSYFADPVGDDCEVYFRDERLSAGTIATGLRRSFYASDVHHRLSELLQVARPDVALVQHYLRKLSPSVLVALREAGVPIVVRLSDFAMVCPEAHLLRDGRVCRECLDHSLLRCVRHRCVQGSAGVSAVASLAMWYAAARRYFDLIDYFVAPSRIMKDSMIDGGFDGDRIVVVPTFVNSSTTGPSRTRHGQVAFVGRISPEKGLHVLIDACHRLLKLPGYEDVKLVVAGNGEGGYAAAVQARASTLPSHIHLLGELDETRVRALLSESAVSVVPSLWYENLPNVMLESLAVGTPVIASDLGSMRDALEGTGAGLLFRCGDSANLARVLGSVLGDAGRLHEMGSAAQRLAETRYSPQAHMAGLLRVLGLARRAGGVSGRPEGS